MERIGGFSFTDSQVSLNLSVMDINEERGREKKMHSTEEVETCKYW